MPPMRRMGRPGLIGTMARTAVITGTANATSRAMNRRATSRDEQRYAADQYNAQQEQQAQLAQQQAYAQQQAQLQAQQQAQVTAAPAEDDLISQLKQLGDLKAAGVLSDAEFAAAKAKLLG
ncbi:SHOCT domain-containing protein [Krasilnikoviella flava]|uniref:Short C-terminal domain-containing protein n=1 Tax=Krasilnikoviella flava TaxID=526729 RepID=A0A1T5L6H8_9MICO|nr:SHOCT domain-containing protein [Krasilnikoviella flava]SKC71676.1 Short C-terminal domain-containing protein [Krasilnikoviella flava]